MSLAPTHPVDPTLGRAATPIAFIRAIALAYRRYGVDFAPALARARIDEGSLSDPAACVTAAQLEALSGHAMRELDDEALGWFSRPLPWGSYGMLCRASLTSPTLGIALKRWCRHHGLLTRDVVWALDRADDVATLTLTSTVDLGAFEEFCIVSVSRYVLGYSCWVVDSRIPLKRVDIPFARPPHHDVYPLLFEGPIHFGADTTRLQFDARYLDLPIRRDESALRALLKNAIPLTVRQYRRDRLLVRNVRETIRNCPGHPNSAEDVAARLNVSIRTLHRQLRAEGASLQKLKNDVRREMAVDLLLRTRQPVKKIAGLVGFENEKSFLRAFKEWTGRPPGAFRSGKTRP